MGLVNENDPITSLAEESSTLGAIEKSSTIEVEKTTEEVGLAVPNSGSARKRFRGGREEAKSLNMSIDGFVCILSAVRYMDDGSVGVSGGHKKFVRFSLDTVARFNLIFRDALRYGWENHFDEGFTPPRFCDANRNPLSLC